MKALKLFSALLGCYFIACCYLEHMNQDPAKKSRFPDDGKPHYVVTVHEYVKYPGAKELEKDIPTFSGRNICVNVNNFIHSRYIEDIETVPMANKPEFYHLKMKLNPRGIKMWINMAVRFKHHGMVFVIDGMAYRMFNPEMVDENTGWVIVEGPFDSFTADALKHFGKKNYEIYNPSSWF